MEAARQKKLKDRLEVVNEEIAKAKQEANVKITGVVHIGTKISMYGNIYTVNEDLKDVKYIYRNHQVEQLSGEE